MKRGVQLRLLLTSRAKGWKKKLGALLVLLENMGAEVRSYADPVVKYHAKYLVVDDRVAVVASLNFTQKCFERDVRLPARQPGPEAGEGTDPALRRRLAFAGRQPSRRTSATGSSSGPEEARDQMTALLAGAERSIRIIDHKLTDPAMLTLLKERRKDGHHRRRQGRVARRAAARAREARSSSTSAPPSSAAWRSPRSASASGARWPSPSAIPAIVRELNAYYHSLTPGAPVPRASERLAMRSRFLLATVAGAMLTVGPPPRRPPPAARRRVSDAAAQAASPEAKKAAQKEQGFRVKLDAEAGVARRRQRSRVDLRALFQFDVRGLDPIIGDPPDDYELPRRRVGIDGELFNLIEFQVEAQLDSDDPWRDVYANLKRAPLAAVPGRQVQGAVRTRAPAPATASLDFVERSNATQVPHARPRRRRHGPRPDGRPGHRVRRRRLRQGHASEINLDTAS